jgi:Leucine-rich repeat (LRR) protein
MELTTEELQNLSELLLSVDDDNTRIAFGIMNGQQGAFKELFTETFVIYKLSEDKEIKNSAYHFLQKQANADISSILNSNIMLGQKGSVIPTELTIRKNISSYVEMSKDQLDGKKMALALYHKYGVGLNFLLKNLSDQLKVNLLKSFITGTSFKLNHCSLSKIPEELYAFTDLTEIDLSHNKIKTVSAKIKVFKHLESLILSKNQINKLNKALATLPHLKKLDISSNKFKEFPPVLAKLEKLEDLNIHELHYTMLGEVYQVPAAFTQLKQLKKINASDNYSSHFGSRVRITLSDFPNFTTITATGDTPLDLKPMHLAKYAYETNGHSEGVFYLFKYCQERALISRIIEEQYYDSSKKLLDLKNTILDDLPPEIANYDIQHLDFKHSCLGAQYYPAGLYSRYYEVPFKTKAEIDTLFAVFENFKDMQSLDLNFNCLVDLPSVIFNWKSLKRLDLRSNKLTGLPDNIGNLLELEYLDLFKNKLKELPASFKLLQNLKVLILGENALDKVPEEIGYLQNLEELHFYNPHMNLPSDQAAQNIPDSFGLLKKLKKIRFYVNDMYYDKNGCKAAYHNRLQELLPDGCKIDLE